MKLFKILGFAVFTIFIFVANGFPDASGIRLIGRVNDWAPLYFKETGIWQGISVDAYRALVQEAGIGLELNLLPWSRAMKAMEDEPMMIANLSWTKERAQIMYFFGPHHREVMGIAIAAKYKNERIRDLDALAALAAKTEKRVVYQQDVFYSDAFNERIKTDAAFSSHFQKRGSNMESSVKMVLENRILGFLEEKSTLAYLIRKHKVKDRIVVHNFQFSEPSDVYIGVSKSISKDLYNRLKEADRQLHEKKIYLELMKKWAPEQ